MTTKQMPPVLKEIMQDMAQSEDIDDRRGFRFGAEACWQVLQPEIEALREALKIAFKAHGFAHYDDCIEIIDDAPCDCGAEGARDRVEAALKRIDDFLGEDEL